MWGRHFIFITSLIILLFSCTKNVEITVPKGHSRLVVNCLFNPDSSWRVFIGKGRLLDDTVRSSFLDHANVSLIDNEGNHIELAYLDSGYYASNLKPKPDIKYTITVTAEGFDPVVATNSIPANRLKPSDFRLDTTPVLITPANVFDNVKVNRLNLKFESLSIEDYVQIQVYAYNENELYDYTITQLTLDTMKGIPFIDDYTLKRLSLLKNIPFQSETRFRYAVNQVTANPNAYYAAVKYAHRTSDPIHFDQLFKMVGIYAQQMPFFNITGDYYSAFTEGNQDGVLNDLLLYTSYDAFDPTTWGYDPINNGTKKDIEMWLYITTLSPSAYQYMKTYIQQQLNRENPFVQPVEVYNNIKGGFGIFAGYQSKRIRVY